ncbi:putative MFS family arabinose efflux permease [Kushneria sinocarnis]|uniref:Putative MFS family arabinose efflux permease n=1 Tax=Kushneria sinocarnis TaxID=595502 RepID=A0A420WX06_9GAMM|nr:MFS transporter [Kushneria sinocarnis]RKR04281.1 putative MFS family arabinose efflux permease [Kushneria sinocarnis]
MARQLLALVLAPLSGLFILALGNGFLSTLVTLRLNMAGASVNTIGWVSAAYYIGLALGALFNDRLLLRIGHIRAYACFASLVAVSALAQSLWLEPWSWFALRLLGGWATVGVYLVIESWLLTSGDRSMRGRMLAFYMIALYGALALGQLLLGVFQSAPVSTPYVLIGMLATLSILPLAIIPRVSPLLEQAVPLSPLKLVRITPTGVTGAFGSGVIVAALYSLLPLYLQQQNYMVEQIGQLMAIMIVGGMALQYPIGRWSDRHDRQIVLIALGGVLVVLALALTLVVGQFWLLAGVLFLFGGGAFSFYPVAVGHAADRAPAGALVSMSQGLLLINAVGCTLSAPVLTSVMNALGEDGLFYGFALAALALALFFAWRRGVRPAPQPVAPFAAAPMQSVVGAELEVTEALVTGAEEARARAEEETPDDSGNPAARHSEGTA